MQIRTFASVAALSLALGATAALANANVDSPNAAGGQQNSTFNNQDSSSDASRPDISSQSAPEQQAASPSDEPSASSTDSGSIGGTNSGMSTLPEDSAQSMDNSSASADTSSAAGLSGDQLAQDQDFVRQVQTRLKDQGYEVGTVDGIWGPESQQALTQFQRDKGLEASGKLGPEVATALDIDAPSQNQTAQQPSGSGAGNQQ